MGRGWGFIREVRCLKGCKDQCLPGNKKKSVCGGGGGRSLDLRSG